jgi:hypothetical protein
LLLVRPVLASIRFARGDDADDVTVSVAVADDEQTQRRAPEQDESILVAQQPATCSRSRVGSSPRSCDDSGVIVHLPPAPWAAPPGTRTVFLAGSIEMGTADDWQSRVVAALGDRDLVVLNPRRLAWDASWRQAIDEPQFREQVEWELDGLERADTIAMWFAPDTRAPITLLELGLFARTGKLSVGCPDGYWRKGNVEVTCARYGVRLAHDWAAFIADVIRAAVVR